MKKLLLIMLFSLRTFAYEIVIDESLSQKEIDKIKFKNFSLSKKTWMDEDTGLIWQVDVSAKKYNWTDAKEFCHNLTLDSYDNWKLPTKDELNSIRIKKSYKHTKKSHIKEPLLRSMDMKYQNFWSDTNYNFSFAWYINFNNGLNQYYSKSFKNYIRCVKEK